MPQRATKKQRRREPPSPLADLRLEALPEGAEKERVLLAVRCFDAGDFRRVRAFAEELGRSGSEDVRAAAEALRARVAVDPVQLAIVGACALLLLAVALTFLH